VLLLLVAVPALMARPWGVVEWSALAVVTGSALLALPLSTRVAHLLGAGTGQVWAVASALLGLLLGVLVVAGLLRVRGAADAAALAVRPA